MMKDREGQSGFSGIPIVHEAFTFVERVGPEFRSRFDRLTQEEIIKANELFQKVKEQLYFQDHESYVSFFGGEDPNRESPLIPFSKRGFNSRLYKFGKAQEFMMKIWGGKRLTPAMINTKTEEGHLAYLLDQENVKSVIDEINEESKLDGNPVGALDHFLMNPHASVWVRDSENLSTGTLVELSRFLHVIDDPSELKKVLTENENLSREAKYVEKVHYKLKGKHGIGFDLF